jgi:hypothetical protein
MCNMNHSRSGRRVPRACATYLLHRRGEFLAEPLHEHRIVLEYE